MADTARATITLPAAVMAWLREEAAERGVTVGSLVNERIANFERPEWFGMGHDDPDLSLHIEEILRRSIQAPD